MVAGGAAAGPILAGCILAELVEFGRIYAEEPDTFTGKAETVAVAGARPAGNGLGRLVEKASGKGNNGEKNKRCQRTGEIAKAPPPTKTERHGFTPC